MQFLFNACQPFQFLFLDGIHRDTGPTGDDVFDIRLGHQTHGGGFGNVVFVANAAQALALELFLVLVVLGLLEILRGDRTFEALGEELQPALNVGDFRRQRGLAQFHARSSFIEKVDGLIGQEAIRNIAIRKIDGPFDGVVGVVDEVELLVARLHALKNSNRLAFAGRSHLHCLEAAFQRAVLFDGFAEFRRRGCPDALDLSSRQRGLQDICGIERTFRRTGAHQSVQFIDENHGVGIVDQFFHDGLQPFFKLPAVFRTGNDERKIEHQDALLRQERRDFAVDNALRKSFDNGRLTYAGIPDEHGIVLGPAAEDLDHAVDFRIAADQRIEYAVHRGLRKVAGEFTQQRRLFRFDHRLTIRNGPGQFVANRNKAQSALMQDFRGNTFLFPQNAQKEVLCADMTMIQSLRFLVGIGEDALALVRKGQVDRGRDLLANGRARFNFFANAFDRGRIAKEPISQILILTDESQQQMFGFDRCAAELTGLVPSEEDNPTSSFRISFKHIRWPNFNRSGYCEQWELARQGQT